MVYGHLTYLFFIYLLVYFITNPFTITRILENEITKLRNDFITIKTRSFKSVKKYRITSILTLK